MDLFDISKPVCLTLHVEGTRRAFKIRQGTSEIARTSGGIVTVKPKATDDEELPDSTDNDYETESEILARLGWFEPERMRRTS
jgi:hypothetical protein